MADTSGLNLCDSLLRPTPSGCAKLIAAWDGLSTGTQIVILSRLGNAKFPRYLAERIRAKALNSTNGYVRYLAAKGLSFVGNEASQEKKALKQRIEEDPDPLVRYCHLETEFNIFDQVLWNPEAFFALPQEARLTKVRCLRGNGGLVAKLVSYAVDNYLEGGNLSDIELFEILSDYLEKPEFKEYYSEEYISRTYRYDGMSTHLAGKDIEELWRLVLKVPKTVCAVLVENLPEKAGLSEGIPKEVVEGLDHNQLMTLLYRQDVELKGLRKQLFFSAAKTPDRVRDAAISWNFDLEYADFAAILTKPKKERVTTLENLALMASDLSLCLYDAIHDVLFNSDDDKLFGSGCAWDARLAMDRRLERLKGHEREEQILQLRLYRLAKQAVTWKEEGQGYAPPAKLAFLGKHVVRGDTWATFMAFSRAWADNWPDTKKLEKHLPRVYDEQELWDAEQTEHEHLTDLVKDKLSEIHALVTGTEEDKTQLFEKLGELVGHTSATTAQVVNNLQLEIASLQAAQIRLKYLSYVLIGLLAYIIIFAK